MDKYQNVFSPFKFANIQIKNRIEVAPMLSCLVSPDGFITREFIEFYRSFARGGAGIVTLGDTAVDYEYAPGHHNQLNLGDDRVIGGLSTMVEAIHRYGAKASIELNHAGRRATPYVLNGRNPIGPSPIPAEQEEISAMREGRRKVQVQEMDQDMIDRVIDHFASACYRCMMAGLDMVMIHGGHGHLLSQFVSPYTNKRTDSYGGSLINRARFVIELLSAARRKVGDKLAIEYRISADEFVPGGMNAQDTIEFIKLIEDKIDLIHVSVGSLNDPNMGYVSALQPTYFPKAHNIERAEIVKKSVKIPVVCVGSIMDLGTANKVIAEGKADIVAMGRAVLADPDIVNKTYREELSDIRPCIRCLCCVQKTAHFYPVRCAINPARGREVEYSCLPQAEKKKRVVIVGGGPAGMEAALIASSRGHHVTMYEKETELGGALRYAAAPSFKADMKKYLDWMINKIQQLDIEIKTAREATPDDVRAVAPDVLIVAVGAEPLIPDIPGIKDHNVVWAGDVTTGKKETGDNVIIAGGGLTGCETALYLAQAGKKVIVIDVLDETGIAQDAPFLARDGLIFLLKKNNIEFITEVKLEEINPKGVIVRGKQWNPFEVSADTIVLALGMKARTELVKSFEGLAREVYVVGDCAEPRNLMSAVHDGFNIASEI